MLFRPASTGCLPPARSSCLGWLLPCWGRGRALGARGGCRGPWRPGGRRPPWPWGGVGLAALDLQPCASAQQQKAGCGQWLNPAVKSGGSMALQPGFRRLIDHLHGLALAHYCYRHFFDAHRPHLAPLAPWRLKLVGKTRPLDTPLSPTPLPRTSPLCRVTHRQQPPPATACLLACSHETASSTPPLCIPPAW